MSKEFTIYRLFVFLAVFRIQFIATQELEICADAELGSACILTCKTPDNTRTVSFAKTIAVTTTLGTCFLNGGSCIVSNTSLYNITQNGGVTKFTILSHSKSETGTWRCKYGSTAYDDKTLKWAKLPTTISTSTGISSNTTVNETSSIYVTVGVGCLYSENAPNVQIKYIPGTYASVMTCAKSATTCTDPDLLAYDCNKTITSADAKCGDTLYTMQLDVSVSNTRNTFQLQLFSPYTIKFACSQPTTVSTTSTTLNNTTTYHHPNPGSDIKNILIPSLSVVGGVLLICAIIAVIKHVRRRPDRKENINMTKT